MYMYAGRYYVKSINYRHHVEEHEYYGFYGDITLVDNELQKDNCSSLPCYSLAISNFSQLDSYDPYYRSGLLSVASVTFMKCSKRVASDSHVDTKPCTKGAYSVDTPPNFSQMKVYSYVVHEFDLLARDIKDSCTITMIAFAPGYIREQEGEWYSRVSSPYKDLHNMMTDGFKLSYEVVNLRGRTFRLCFLGFSYQGAECSFYYSLLHSFPRVGSCEARPWCPRSPGPCYSVILSTNAMTELRRRGLLGTWVMKSDLLSRGSMDCGV
ncbi:uncharacterized protein LOC104453403 isoform X5 [Eucalyptus grandis]|uniref:uncharacterized protein LOC104453403 isoform X5 n=1 Tax=Eucalyptus grandis TaxID=71139 RepID=UPI00192EB0AF|nr:uncharacterized protein LOC104453403 isoform X5 [Eucalyptus grandis]